MTDRFGRQQRGAGRVSSRASDAPVARRPRRARRRRRRTPGFRREEVAQRCGLSVTWYTGWSRGVTWRPRRKRWQRWRGRCSSRGPSAPICSGSPAGSPRLGYPTTRRSTCRRRWPGARVDRGSCLRPRRLWIAAPARPARRLFVGWLDGGRSPNLLRYVFLNPIARQVIPDWTERARRMLAEFRAESRHPRTRRLVRWSTACGHAAISSRAAGTSRGGSSWAASARSSTHAMANSSTSRLDLAAGRSLSGRVEGFRYSEMINASCRLPPAAAGSSRRAHPYLQLWRAPASGPPTGAETIWIKRGSPVRPATARRSWRRRSRSPPSMPRGRWDPHAEDVEAAVDEDHLAGGAGAEIGGEIDRGAAHRSSVASARSGALRSLRTR